MPSGLRGAEGLEGGRALAASLDQRTFEDDVDWRRSEAECLVRNLRYLLRKTGGPAAMEEYGLTAAPEALAAWLEGASTPFPEQERQLESAFRSLRRRNIAPSLTRTLDAGGGTRIQIAPVDQVGVEARYRRDLRVRYKNIYRWGPIVRAWAAQDSMELDQLWEEVITDMGSDYRKYQCVESISVLG